MKKFYRNHNNINKLAIWGQPPPPIGGMSVHISRLIQHLEREKIDYKMYSFQPHPPGNDKIFYVRKNIFRWIYTLIIGPTEKVHYVLSRKSWVQVLIIIIGKIRKRKIIFRVGYYGLLNNVDNGSLLKNTAMKFAFKNAAAVIGVSEELCDRINKIGVSKEKIHHIPGYISPPNIKIYTPTEIDEFYNNKFPKLITSGQIVKNRNDTYGLWSLIDVIGQLSKYYKNIGLLIFAYEIIPLGQEPYQLMGDYIKAKTLEKSILIYKSNTEMWPSIKKADIFIRNTLIDGDANAIREAISLGVPVIASNCVRRPEPAITYPLHRYDILVNKLIDMVKNIGHYKKSTSEIKIKDNSEELIRLIKNLLNN
jgi:glycosyltransferase involved in cell wall biosynthesis